MKKKGISARHIVSRANPISFLEPPNSTNLAEEVETQRRGQRSASSGWVRPNTMGLFVVECDVVVAGESWYCFEQGSVMYSVLMLPTREHI